MRKRKNGEGSVFFDKTRNKYTATLYDPNGTRIQKRFNTEQEASDWLTVTKAEIVNNSYIVPTSITLGEWMNRFLEYSKKPSVKESTFAKYKYCVNHLKPIGKLQLQSLTPVVIQKFYTTLEHLGPVIRKQIHILLAEASREAVANDLIRKDFMATVKAPKVERKTVSVFTKEELDKLYVVCKNHSIKWEAIFLLAATTGMRRGEITGLQIESVSETNVYVNHTLQEINGVRTLSTPKTKNSKRFCTISKEVHSLLMEIIGNRKTGYVFLSSNNTPLFSSNWETSWRKLVKKANIPYRNFHSIRHTYASTLIDQGVPIATVSKILGHSSPVTTLSIYVHPVHESDTKVAEITNKMFDFSKVDATVASDK